MKKVLFIIAMAMFVTSCEHTELETANQEYKKSVSKEQEEDVNFRIFKDRTQTGKGETR